MSDPVWELPPRSSGEDPAKVRPGNHISPTPTKRQPDYKSDAEELEAGEDDEISPITQPNFAKLFKMTEEFAKAHLNHPDEQKDNMVAHRIGAFIYDAAPPPMATQLLADSESRYHLLTKSILLWLKEAVLNHALFAKLNYPAARRLSVLRDTLYCSMLPSCHKICISTDIADLTLRSRHSVLCQIGRDIETIMAIPNFNDLLYGLVQQQSSDLYDLIYPLMHRPGKSPYYDLINLIYEAYDVSMVMGFLPVDWEFEYPSTNVRFQPVMVNRDPGVFLSTEEIMAGDWRVRLGFIPRVMFKAYDNNFVSDWLVFRPHVLLRS